jgi:hypothetical protein
VVLVMVCRAPQRSRAGARREHLAQELVDVIGLRCVVSGLLARVLEHVQRGQTQRRPQEGAQA